MDIDLDAFESIPDLSIAKCRFLLSLGSKCPSPEDTRRQIVERMKENRMVALYQTLKAELDLPADAAWKEDAEKKNDEEEKTLVPQLPCPFPHEQKEKIADAEENMGESEVRECNLRLALFYCSRGLKVEALPPPHPSVSLLLPLPPHREG